MRRAEKHEAKGKQVGSDAEWVCKPHKRKTALGVTSMTYAVANKRTKKQLGQLVASNVENAKEKAEHFVNSLNSRSMTEQAVLDAMASIKGL